MNYSSWSIVGPSLSGFLNQKDPLGLPVPNVVDVDTLNAVPRSSANLDLVAPDITHQKNLMVRRGVMTMVLSNYPPGANTDDAPFNTPDYDDIPCCDKCFREFDFWVDIDDEGREVLVPIKAIDTADGLICEDCVEEE